MALEFIEFDYESVVVPPEVRHFLSAVEARIEQHRINLATTYRGFVPSDYSVSYQCLKALYDSHLLCGERFCEWGSGISIIAAQAAMIGYESYAIEYDRELCLAGAEICREFDVAVDVVNGSFIPEGVEDLIDAAFTSQEDGLALHTEPDRAYEEMGLEVDDFDLIFCYPWPNDLELTHDLFDRCAATGALLLVFTEMESILIHRKC